MKRCILVVILLLSGIAVFWKIAISRINAKRFEFKADTLTRLQGLCSQIKSSAMIDGPTFHRLIGESATEDVVALPIELWAAMPGGRGGYIFQDAWGQVLHVRIENEVTNLTNGLAYYTVFVWSNGPNRSNEIGGGDDISMTWTNIACRIN